MNELLAVLSKDGDQKAALRVSFEAAERWEQLTRGGKLLQSFFPRSPRFSAVRPMVLYRMPPGLSGRSAPIAPQSPGKNSITSPASFNRTTRKPPGRFGFEI
jgi:hypothetical protein